jgi:Reverse transcriptase (RNA-dependent DNA polymerase)
LADVNSTLANLSLSRGQFPSLFKQASITPILTKCDLDSSSFTNYRRIYNFNIISKLLEHLSLSRTKAHVLNSSNYNKNQSAYRCHHSTETALPYSINSLVHSSDCGKSTLLVSLDVSAAFDIIDHSILLNRLHKLLHFLE